MRQLVKSFLFKWGCWGEVIIGENVLPIGWLVTTNAHSITITYDLGAIRLLDLSVTIPRLSAIRSTHTLHDFIGTKPWLHFDLTFLRWGRLLLHSCSKGSINLLYWFLVIQHQIVRLVLEGSTQFYCLTDKGSSAPEDLRRVTFGIVVVIFEEVPSGRYLIVVYFTGFWPPVINFTCSPSITARPFLRTFVRVTECQWIFAFWWRRYLLLVHLNVATLHLGSVPAGLCLRVVFWHST